VEPVVARLVRQDKCNSFGYNAPYGAGKRQACGSDVSSPAGAQTGAGAEAGEEEEEEDEDEDEDDPTERSVRASGVFPLLALANHSCMPTVYRERLRLDGGGGGVGQNAGGINSSRRVAFRAMSDCSATYDNDNDHNALLCNNHNDCMIMIIM
jgi:hypothetical protein